MADFEQYEIAGIPLSDWTNKFLTKCEELRGTELDEDEIIYLLDYAVGFGLVEDIEQIAAQTVEAVFAD